MNYLGTYAAVNLFKRPLLQLGWGLLSDYTLRQTISRNYVINYHLSFCGLVVHNLLTALNMLNVSRLAIAMTFVFVPMPRSAVLKA